MEEQKNPMETILLHIYRDHGWGDPFGFAGDPEEAADLKELAEVVVLPDIYKTLPTLVCSEKSCSFRDFSKWPLDFPGTMFDLLGEYKIYEPEVEGDIILYEKCIRGFGRMVYDRFGKELGYSRLHSIDLVRDIVRWHELGHWIIHWMPDPDGNRWDNKTYAVTLHNNSIHEGLAQLFTFYAIILCEDELQRSEYLMVFNFMLQQQAPWYQGHNIILQDKRFSWIGVFKALKEIRNNPPVGYAGVDQLLEYFD